MIFCAVHAHIKIHHYGHATTRTIFPDCLPFDAELFSGKSRLAQQQELRQGKHLVFSTPCHRQSVHNNKISFLSHPHNAIVARTTRASIVATTAFPRCRFSLLLTLVAVGDSSSRTVGIPTPFSSHGNRSVSVQSLHFVFLSWFCSRTEHGWWDASRCWYFCYRWCRRWRWCYCSTDG
jgi:hypothetical protein